MYVWQDAEPSRHGRASRDSKPLPAGTAFSTVCGRRVTAVSVPTGSICPNCDIRMARFQASGLVD
ncbi:zinc finger protein [Amycolatopsis sp. DSM 110486]|uniref:zinc finger protein n=1 Tax=Amycolatopsis sp. DSM 110486 TaxID=2865832 RepID=UPI001C696FE6|nr:zinc finger protein [Amycolatopsis sp. DSM 110486]QYN17478.1 hypothetical protein K1T34_32350 [Amycolatopsis sp. DSM 110486]